METGFFVGYGVIAAIVLASLCNEEPVSLRHLLHQMQTNYQTIAQK